MKYKILLIVNYDHSYDQLSYYDDWVKSFVEHKKVNLTLIDFKNVQVHKNEEFDFIFLHHSTNADSLLPLEYLKKFLLSRKEEILVFVGNEFNNIFSPIKEKRRLFKELNISFICSMLVKEAALFLWSDIARKKVILTPPGLNTNHFFDQRPIKDREFDIGFKGIRYYSYIGDTERNDMVEKFSKIKKLKLSIDFTRFNAKKWSIFLNSCKSVISSEAGSYFVDLDDKVIGFIINKIKNNTSKLIIPRSNLDKFFYRFPQSFKNFIKYLLKYSPLTHSNIVFEDSEFGKFYKNYFDKLLKPSIYFKCISSRNFDAIGTKTLQILLEGKYNNILKPNVHYLSLKKDYSNFDEIIEKLSDIKAITKIINNAYNHVITNHTYEKRINHILTSIT